MDSTVLLHHKSVISEHDHGRLYHLTDFYTSPCEGIAFSAFLRYKNMIYCCAIVIDTAVLRSIYDVLVHGVNTILSGSSIQKWDCSTKVLHPLNLFLFLCRYNFKLYYAISWIIKLRSDSIKVKREIYEFHGVTEITDEQLRRDCRYYEKVDRVKLLSRLPPMDVNGFENFTLGYKSDLLQQWMEENKCTCYICSVLSEIKKDIYFKEIVAYFVDRDAEVTRCSKNVVNLFKANVVKENFVDNLRRKKEKTDDLFGDIGVI